METIKYKRNTSPRRKLPLSKNKFAVDVKTLGTRIHRNYRSAKYDPKIITYTLYFIVSRHAFVSLFRGRNAKNIAGVKTH